MKDFKFTKEERDTIANEMVAYEQDPSMMQGVVIGRIESLIQSRADADGCADSIHPTTSDPAQPMQDGEEHFNIDSYWIETDDLDGGMHQMVLKSDYIRAIHRHAASVCADKDREIARLRIMVDTCEKAYDGMAILHRAECAKTKSLESELAELKRRKQAAPKIVLPEQDVLLSQATEYANSRLPQQYSLIDRSDWVEYKDDIVEYILDTLYGKVTND